MAGEAQVWGRTSQTISVNAAGGILRISSPESFVHRQALVATWLPAWLQEAHLQVRDQTMMDETGKTLSLNTAKTWHGPRLPETLPECPSLAQPLLQESFPAYHQSWRAWALMPLKLCNQLPRIFRAFCGLAGRSQ